jgi:hypothetical protein
MEQSGHERGQLSKRFQYAALGFGFAILAALSVCEWDTSLFLILFVAAPVLFLITLASLTYAAIAHHPVKRTAETLAVLWVMVVCFVLYSRAHPFAIRESAKWLLYSREYKQEVLAQPTPANAELKHLEWESSGFAGVANNISYLVFDPTDALSATTSNQNSKLKGVPCEPRAVRRLENHWYAVLFYTDQVWDDDCGADFSRPRSSSVLQDPHP